MRFLDRRGSPGPGIAQSDDEAGFPLEIQQLAEFFAVKPAQDAGGEPLRLGFSSEVGGGNANVHRAVVLVLHFGAHRGRPIVSGFGDDQEDRNLPGEAVHAHAPGGGAYGFSRDALGYGDVIGLGVAGRGGQPGSFQAGQELLFFHGAGSVISPAALPGAGNFQIIHEGRPPFR